MQTNLTQNVLGFITSLSLLSSCSDIARAPVEPYAITLPEADPLVLRNVEWRVINSDNIETIIQTDSVIFGLNTQNYENLALNINDIRTYLAQQQRIINAYEEVYNDQSRAATSRTSENTQAN